ncbi:MAG: RNA methyltransferase, partial [Chloroflexi bacterium]|nr:RNA methyltransferase [Chloroflexota bacterium]
MAYDLKLAERIRAELKGVPVIEKKMFGGVGYMLNGNMACGILRGDMIVRVSSD